MKTVKTTTLIILVALFSHVAQAQTFENTCWKAYSTTYNITVQLHFYPGNIYAYENDNGFPLDTIGYYYESNDTITFIDYQGDCNGDTGIYTFQIQNNVLDFTTVSDACTDRVDQADGLVWSPCPPNNVLENTCWTAGGWGSSTWIVIKFLTGNLYTYESNNIPYDTIGTYSITNDTIVFTDFQGDCNNTIGIYTFEFQNSFLDFTLVSDTCQGRVAQAGGFLWAACSSNVVLENTCWWAADSASTATMEIEFLPGNLYTYKSNQIQYDTIGYYTLSNNTIFFEDFKGDCNGGLGVYSFYLQNDRLDFILITDDCLGRVEQAGGLLWTNCAVVGLDEEGIEYSIVAYPNPTRDEVNLAGLPQGKACTYQLMNINGQVVQTGDLENPSISLAHLPTGLYLLSIPEINQSIKIHKQ